MMGDILKPRRRDSSTHVAYLPAIFSSAPQAATILIELKISFAVVEAWMSACCTSFNRLTRNGVVAAYVMMINSNPLLVMRARDQL
jgi:hypothetical protein